MKTANKCPKCGAKNCDTPINQSITQQSDLCRERCKVAKLRKQVERLKDKLQTAENLAFNLDCTLINARRMIHELETRNSEANK